ncbi:hypothetical protein [Streptosporangium vulgare]|uniref:Uncharacterized protein n=1 Tax=Streptosporangium vulgare TaxID=46190 RepID=A0ABV5T9B8_9ACTN
MSFELAVWYEPKPITREHAEKVFQSLRHGEPHRAAPHPGDQEDASTERKAAPEEREDAGTAPLRERKAGPEEQEGAGTAPSGERRAGPEEQEGPEAHPGVTAFAGRLPGAEWLSPDHLLVGMDPERADEVSAGVFALAAECGLVCYDPQRGLVHNLSPRGVYPTMELRTGDGMIVVGPDLQLISDALATMSPQNPFTALVVFGEHFVQSSPEITGYELEYKDSVRNRMFRTHVPDLGAVQDAFTEYATGERAFLERHDWKLV